MTFLLSPSVYVAMMVAYALALALFFVDFLRDNKAANRIGLVMLGTVWILESAFLGVRMAVDHRLPFFTSDQATVLYAWLLVTVSAAVSYLSRIDFFTLFVNLFGFLFVAFDTFVHGRGIQAQAKQSDLLLLHVTFAFLAYLAFAMSAIWSMLYLLEESALRSKRFGSGAFRRLPALEKLDAFAYRTSVVGLPVLFVAIALGIVWSLVLTGQIPWADPKTLASLALFALYASYAWLRRAGYVSGQKAAWLNLVAFASLLVNFLVIGEFLSGFHRW